MQQYTFKVPPEGEAGFLFDITAEDEATAVSRAKTALGEHFSREHEIHVDVSFGLTFGRVLVNPDDLTTANIMDVYIPPESTEPF